MLSSVIPSKTFNLPLEFIISSRTALNSLSVNSETPEATSSFVRPVIVS